MNTTGLTQYLNTLAEESALTGVSACVRGTEGVLYTYNYGYIDADHMRCPNNDTLFGIASMSKSITALCACLLSLEGKLSLDDPVCKFFPDFRVPGEPREAVTVRHLAMHTAGIPPMEPLEWSIVMNTPSRDDSEYDKKLRETAPNPMSTIEEIIQYIAACPYPNTGMPGQNLSYSNEGFAILSYIIDQAAGMPLEQYMHEHIFAPLGMTRSILDNGYLAAQALSGGNMTSLFERDGDTLTCDDNWSILPPFRGCAMVKSTSYDMAGYYLALSNYGVHDGQQVIPREAVELLLGKHHPLNAYSTMCMGINKRQFQGHIICEHAGGLHGVSTKGGLLLGEGIGISVLCNLGDADVDPLIHALYNAALDLPFSQSHEWFNPVLYSFTDTPMLLGEYICHEGIPAVISITEDDGQLTLTDDNTHYRLHYCGRTCFRADNDKGSLVSRLEFLIHNGQAWGVRRGTRIFHRKS